MFDAVLPRRAPASHRIGGWLFGLEADGARDLTVGDIVIRPMQDAERATVLRHASSFWVQGHDVWKNLLTRFPFVYEMPTKGDTAIGGGSPFAVALSLLTPGEIRTPWQWSRGETSSGECFSSEIAAFLFRLINGRFQPTGLEHVVSRAADICMALELLFNESSTSEISFRLQMSLGWLLGGDPIERQATAQAIKDAYEVRSKRVHGSEPETLKPKQIHGVIASDLLLRRAILAKLISGLDEGAWKEMFVQARFGRLPPDFDRAGWLTT